MGAALARHAVAPDVLFVGEHLRHRQTLAGIAEALDIDPAAATVDPGLNEIDTDGLIAARFRDGGLPDGVNRDRRAHFSTLRDTVLAWQRGEIADPPEPWEAFEDRLAATLKRMADCGARRVLAVSSGGPIGRIVARVMEAPPAQMIRIQLQTRNCAVTRLVVGRTGLYLTAFNEMPHVTGAGDAHLVSYS